MQTSTDKKMRNSATRNSIYEYLCGTKEHPSAEMIYLDLRETNPTLSFGTVYRNLKQLEETGRVIRVSTLNNRERYDANCSDHLHFACEKCGRVIDLMDADTETALTACGLPGGVKIRSIYGTCELCSENK